MSEYNETVLTNKGREVAVKAANGKAKFTITRVASSADNLSNMSEADLMALTAIPNEVQEASILDKDDSTSDSIIGTTLTFVNSDLGKSYYINTIGMYATLDGEDKEFLYAITTAVEPEFIPDYKDNVVFNFELTIYVIVGQKANVTVNIDPSGYATTEYVDNKVKGLASVTYVDEQIDSINSSIGNGNATQNFNGDWNTLKSNGTYYSVSGTNLPPVSAYWLVRVVANHDGSRVEQMAFQDNGDAVWIRHLNSNWSSWTRLVDKNYVDDKVQSVLDQLTTKLTKLNFSYGNLTVDNDPVVPIVMVADEDTAKSQDASKPHTQHEWSD